ncbi:MAG: 3-deoxy-manno-octulosonate cytidylyltransferase [Bacteroidetes bacterium]|nr:3-deoxy-manno-octulosonate cytidylyltransferase [Bacteroidota bacterium]
MQIFGIIPARYGSTRFPGKPLAMIGGKSMIQRVYEQAGKASSLTKVAVATDDARIEDHVQQFGGNVVMTSEHHLSGTERCAEAYLKMSGEGRNPAEDIIVNIQGDEPFIDPALIDQVTACFPEKKTCIATLAKPVSSPEELFNPNVVKLIFNQQGNAIYFSRSPLPFIRNREEKNWLSSFPYLKHIGIYAYRADTLLQLVKLPPSGLESAESLEQLRWIEYGLSIKVAITDRESIAVDSPEDLLKLTHLYS